MNELRLDYFLANLLFGMILLTSFMSLAHATGDLLSAGFRDNPRVARRLRGAILAICALLALLVYLLKFTWTVPIKSLQPLTQNNSQVLKPYLIKSGFGTLVLENRGVKGTFDRNQSWSLSQSYSLETKSELKAVRNLLKAAPLVLTWIDSKDSPLCQSWLRQIQSLGLKVSGASGVPKLKDHPLLVMCGSDADLTAQFKNWFAYVKEGGGVLILGAMSEANAKTLEEVGFANKAEWRKADLNTPLTAVFRGEMFSLGGVPSGFKLGLGHDWAGQEGWTLLAAPHEVQVYKDPLAVEPSQASPFFMGTYGQGRILWTSLPGELSPRLDSLYGAYWDLLTSRMLTYLVQWPRFGIEHLPSGALKMLLPVVISQNEEQNMIPYYEVMQKQKVNATFFLPMSHQIEKTSFADVIRIQSHSFGVSGLGEFETVSGDIYKQLKRFFEWHRILEKLQKSDEPSASVKAESCCQTGVTLNPGEPATAFAAAIGAGFDYIVGDPFLDWVSPFMLSLDKNVMALEKIASRLKDKSADIPLQTETTTSEKLWVIPVNINSDYRFRKNKELLSPPQIAEDLKQEFRHYEAAKSAMTWPIHTDVFAGAEGILVLDEVLKLLKEEEFEFWKTSDYLTWWQSKSMITLHLEPHPKIKNQFQLKIKNSGTMSAQNLIFSMVPERWQVTPVDQIVQKNGILQIQIKEIKPHEEIIWNLVPEAKEK